MSGERGQTRANFRPHNARAIARSLAGLLTAIRRPLRPASYRPQCGATANGENEMSEVRFQKYESTKCSRCGAQVIGLGAGKPCCEGLSIQQIKDRCLSTHRKIVRNLAAGRDALDGIEDYNGIGPRALNWLEATGVVESGALTRLG